jgi:hypothetical protein
MIGFLYGKFITSGHECSVCKITEIYWSDKGSGLTAIKLVVKVNGQERWYVLKSHIIKNQQHGQSAYQQHF